MENTIKLLHENNVNCKIVVGGAVLTPDYAEKIGADFYARDAKAQKELPARSAEELTAQQTTLTAARETLRSREKQLSAQLLPNRKTAAQYRAAAEARQTLES